MAIAFSAPIYERRNRRTRRESTALSTNISTHVAFGELSLSSQLLYAAMVETWKVVQEIAGEEAEVIFEKKEENVDMHSVTVEDGGMSTGFLAQDFLTELEEDNEELEHIDTDIIGGYEISKFADKNNNDDIAQSVPDLIVASEVGSTKLSGVVPDLVASCLPAAANQNHPQNTDLGKKTNLRQNKNMRRKIDFMNRPDVTDFSTDTTDSTKQGERSRVLDLKRHKNTDHEQLSNNSSEEKRQRQQQETKSSWAETGRQLSRIADAEKRRRVELSRSSPAPSSGLDGRSTFSSLLHEEDLDPLIEKYSDVLSAIAIAGISYLVRRMFN